MSGSNQEAQTEQNNNTTAVVGGPGLTTDSSAATTSNEQAAPTPAETNSPVIIGNMKFGSMDEAGRYLAELKGKSDVIEKLQTMSAPQQAPIEPEAEIADLMFEDPKTAIKIIKQQAKDEAKREIDMERQKDRAWDKFYKDNPDLKEFEDLVQATIQMKYNDIKDLNLDEAIKTVALHTRGTLAKVRGSSSTGTPLPSKPAMVAGSSGAVLPQQQVQKTEPKSFIAQLSALHNRGRKGA